MSDQGEFEAGLASKSELKRRSRDLQDLGDQLVALPVSLLEKLPLPDEVREAVEAARSISSHGARLRQRLYIGKLLRRMDVGPIQEALARSGEADRQRLTRERAVEQWRTRLLADEPGAWTEIAALVGGNELRAIRRLVRDARAEHAAARPPAAARRLFRRLREALPGPDATMRR